jgi:hypothetical protein
MRGSIGIDGLFRIEAYSRASGSFVEKDDDGDERGISLNDLLLTFW